MELHLFEDRIVAGQEIVLADTPARAIYVNAGAVTCNGTVHECDAGFLADGAVTFVSGGIDAGDQNSAPLSTQQMSDGLVASPYGLWGALGAAADGEPTPSDTLN